MSWASGMILSILACLLSEYKESFFSGLDDNSESRVLALLSLKSQNTFLRTGVEAGTYKTPCWRGRESSFPANCLPASLAYWMSSNPVRDPVSKTQGG